MVQQHRWREPLRAHVGGPSFSASLSPSCKPCLRLLDTGQKGQLDGERQPDLVAISGGSGDETFSFDAREIRNFFAPTHLARSPASRRLRELHRLFALKSFLLHWKAYKTPPSQTRPLAPSTKATPAPVDDSATTQLHLAPYDRRSEGQLSALRYTLDFEMLDLRQRGSDRPVLLQCRASKTRQSSSFVEKRLPRADEQADTVHALAQTWPAHKIVCGKRGAHPFRLPPFSRREADQAWRRYCQPATEDLQAQLQRDLRTICEIGTGKDVKVSPISMLPLFFSFFIFFCFPPLTALPVAHVQESLDDLVAKANRPNAQLSLDDLDIILAVRAMSGSWYCTLPANSPHPPYLETFATTYDSLTGGNRAPSSDPVHEMRHSQLCHRLLAHTVLYLRVDTIMQNLKAAQKKTPALIPDEARLLKQNYDALLEFASNARKEAPEWEIGQKLEANLQKYLADLGEADLTKALTGST